MSNLAGFEPNGATYADTLLPERELAIGESETERAFSELLAASAAASSGTPDGPDLRVPGALSQQSFRAAAAHLGLDYFGEAEVHRVWKRLHEGRTVPRGSEITCAEFCQAVPRNASLCSLVTQINAHVAAQKFTVPEGYDYSQPTCTNYALDTLVFFGPYADERRGGEPPSRRDYSYHNNYTRERQEWQDHIVRLTVTRHNPQPRPWIVFTCGAMGCGKGYTFKKMSERGHFPIEDIVRVDPDSFRLLMPEWKGYTARGLAAGTMTHKESGYIQELCQEAALRRQQNIWVDGSLRDAAWFSAVFDDIRRRHPIYRVGIIYVHASEAVVRERVAERAARTGRSVPEELITASIAAPRNTLFELETKCDWVARIDNEVSPRLASFIQVDRTGNWGVMSSRWARVEPAPSEFPNRLAPMAMQRVDGVWLGGSTAVPPGGGPVRLDWHDPPGQQQQQQQHQQLQASRSRSAEVVVAPMFLLLITQTATWDIARHHMGIDEGAVWIAFATPVGPEHQLFPNGGFLCFDQAKRLIRAVRVAGQCSTCRFRHYLEFNLPVRKEARDIRALLEQRERWAEVRIPELRNGGARRFAWVCPGEIPDSGGLGAFLYELQDCTFVLFPVRVPST